MPAASSTRKCLLIACRVRREPCAELGDRTRRSAHQRSDERETGRIAEGRKNRGAVLKFGRLDMVRDVF